MRALIRGFAVIAIMFTMVAGSMSTASAAHLGNNKATFGGNVSGQAIVNYSKGQGTFNGTISVRGLMPNTAYEFEVSGAAAGSGIVVCSGVSNSQGMFSCNFQGMTLPGFATAQVELAGTETTVAMADFARRGNCRAPDQAGSLCQAQNH